MNRLQKKCLVASMCGHVGLVGILLFASAFTREAPSRETPTDSTITVVPPSDTPGHVVSPAAPAIEQRSQSRTQIPQTTAVPAAPTPEAEEAVPEPVKPVVPRADISIRENPQPRHVVHVNIGKPIQISKQKQGEEDADAEKTAENEAQSHSKLFAEAVRKIGTGTYSAISRGLSGATLVSVGEPRGEEVFSTYRDAVFSAYYNAWTPPDDVSGETATVARIVVARDGTIETFEIFHKSGKHSMDASVEAALRSVRQLRPFPEESKDLRRTFKIKFQPQAKQSLG